MTATTVLTERLQLRQWESDDLARLTDIFAKREVWRFPFGRGLHPQETERFLERQLDHQRRHEPAVWAADVRGEDRLIGFIGLSLPEFLPEIMPAVEVGWRLDPGWWGQGLATEGGRAALEHGFEALGLERIVSIYQPENIASGAVMARIGLRHDLDTVHPDKGVVLRVCAIERDEWARWRPSP